MNSKHLYKLTDEENDTIFMLGMSYSDVSRKFFHLQKEGEIGFKKLIKIELIEEFIY
ncbi:hypothetical protein OD91_0870 [Lutibacter sp. Hel_I_33_5]|uniref:hypothetical protein n=1 Tax=Lutibacter sp. Hel_I_33_5 TaxID=1566289 RepID=UPI0011AB9422|nr:hypothetical protein [Lutibacter sp. Hel_I_33_5]TVZ55615.1 hypothetical protein OD91_0870 [Lutibacter sp. Hel_I_33_5]